MLVDVDYLHGSVSTVQREGWSLDMSQPPYFRNNYFLKWLVNIMAPPVEGRRQKYKGESANPLREFYFDIIGDILPQLFNVGGRPQTQVNRDGSLLTFLDTLKNLLVGKIKHPHTHMINHGIQAITFEGIYNEKLEKKHKKQNDAFQ